MLSKILELQTQIKSVLIDLLLQNQFADDTKVEVKIANKAEFKVIIEGGRNGWNVPIFYVEFRLDIAAFITSDDMQCLWMLSETFIKNMKQKNLLNSE